MNTQGELNRDMNSKMAEEDNDEETALVKRSRTGAAGRSMTKKGKSKVAGDEK